jgi:hypothetical protein
MVAIGPELNLNTTNNLSFQASIPYLKYLGSKLFQISESDFRFFSTDIDFTGCASLIQKL